LKRLLECGRNLSWLELIRQRGVHCRQQVSLGYHG